MFGLTQEKNRSWIIWNNCDTYPVYNVFKALPFLSRVKKPETQKCFKGLTLERNRSWIVQNICHRCPGCWPCPGNWNIQTNHYWLWHYDLTLPLMNSFNKTEAAIFPIQTMMLPVLEYGNVSEMAPWWIVLVWCLLKAVAPFFIIV